MVTDQLRRIPALAAALTLAACTQFETPACRANCGPQTTPSPPGTPGPTQPGQPGPSKKDTPQPTQPQPPGQACNATALRRSFKLPTPLFSPGSAWNQKVTDAAVLSGSEATMKAELRKLRAISGSWVSASINFEEWSIPIFCADSTNKIPVDMCDYEGSEMWHSNKWTGAWPEGPGGTLQIGAPKGPVRPAGPVSTDSDGHMVLYDPVKHVAFEFWQATTSRQQRCSSAGGGIEGAKVLEAGAADFFDTLGFGTNHPEQLSSARASGVSLLAGLLLPEDIAGGEIRHALSFSISKPRNLSGDPYDPKKSDILYPASHTETDFFSTDPASLASGQRIRLKQQIRDTDGAVINEATLAPVTRIFLKALRAYGAYLVDNSGSFTFYAEDVHTGWLDVSADQVNQLIGAPAGTPLDPSKSKWKVVMDKLSLELESLPLAGGPWKEGDNPNTAQMTFSNFEVVTPAQPYVGS